MRLLLLLAAICGLLASLMSSAIGHAHLLFRLSRDGLLPSWLGQFGSDVSTLNHHQPVQLPVRCLVCGCVFSLLAAHLLSAVSLLRMLGVGTLLNFLCVSLALLWLRYDFPEQLPLEHSQQPLTSSNSRCEPSACCDCCCACVGRLGSAARLCLLHDNHKVQPVVALQGSFYFERERLRRASGGPFKRSISDCLLQQQRLQKSYVGPADYGTCAAVSCACNHFAATAAATTVAVDSHDHRPSAGTYTSCNSLESITEEIDLRTSIKRRTRNDLCRQICVKYENHSVVSLLGFEFALNNQLPTSRSARKVKIVLFTLITLMLATGLTTSQALNLVPMRQVWPLEVFSLLLCLIICLLVVWLTGQPRHENGGRNALPCVPLLPVCAMWMHLHLMLCLSTTAWLTFLIWTLIGIFVYMSFGIWRSNECSRLQEFDLFESGSPSAEEDDMDGILDSEVNEAFSL